MGNKNCFSLKNALPLLTLTHHDTKVNYVPRSSSKKAAKRVINSIDGAL
jgi:hypothetical protein